jgi:DNA-binding beta-propeller fold protein YncE
MAFDGVNIWISNFASNTVTKLRAKDGTMLGTFAVGSNPVGLAFDGANIWVANQQNSSLSKL